MRNDINNQPHRVLGLGLVVILGFSFLLECSEIDVLMQGDYRVVSKMQIASVFVIFLGLMSVIYWATLNLGKKLTKWMTMLHIAFSLFGAITFLFMACEPSTVVEPFGAPGNKMFLWILLAFFSAQLVFAANIIYAFIGK